MVTKKNLFVNDIGPGPTLMPFILAGFENWFPLFPVYLNFVAPLQSSFIFIVLGGYRVLLQLNLHPFGARKGSMSSLPKLEA